MKEVIDQLRNGDIILYPADISWAIGCDATNESACERLNLIHPTSVASKFTLLVDGFPMLERYIPDFHEVCYDLVDYATKPLTIVYPNAQGIAESILTEDGSIGIRITTDHFCKKLIQGMRKPLVCLETHRNDGKVPAYFADIDENVKSRVDHIVLERTEEKISHSVQEIKIGLSGEVTIIQK